MLKYPSKILLLTCGLLTFMVSCGYSQTSSVTPLPPLVLAHEFQNFYRLMGGEAFLGPVISEAKVMGDKEIQFVEKGLLVYNDQATDLNFVTFWPLGKEMKVAERPLEAVPTLKPGAVYLADHVIPPEFAPTYQLLGGLVGAGRPLTEVRYNSALRRFEQFFENVGFYRLSTGDSNTVHLLSYGSWFCKNDCRPSVDPTGLVDVLPPFGEPFDKVANLLGTEITGYPLAVIPAWPHNQSPLQVVYKNMVLTVDNQDPDLVKFVNVPEKLGIQFDHPSVSINSLDYVFVPVNPEGLGFDIPNAMYQYIQSNGGFEVFGNPINSYQTYGKDGRLSRQCFTYLCLLDDPQAESWLRIQPESLGYTYYQMFYRQAPIIVSTPGDPTAGSKNIPPDWDLDALTSEAYPQITPQEAQIIYVDVLDGRGRPVANLEPLLRLQISGKGEIVYQFPPTNRKGHTSITLPQISAENGTLLVYLVCFEREDQQICYEDSFLIWNGQ